jgi:hypothetical protein
MGLSIREFRSPILLIARRDRFLHGDGSSFQTQESGPYILAGWRLLSARAASRPATAMYCVSIMASQRMIIYLTNHNRETEKGPVYGKGSLIRLGQSLARIEVYGPSDFHQPSGRALSPHSSWESEAQPEGFVRASKAKATGIVEHVGSPQLRVATCCGVALE